MRFVVMGAGAVGGAVGGRLSEHGHEVVLVARGAHGRVIADQGLTLRSPSGVSRVWPEVVDDVRALEPRPDDVILLSVKNQDTLVALGQLVARFSVDTPVVCMQNGVANEPMALRSFRNVYGVPVNLPAVFLDPGVVDIHCSPSSGVLDIGRFPRGVDDVARSVSGALRRSGFESEARAEITRWKWTKLLGNLLNAALALSGGAVAGTGVPKALRAEALACFAAAGISHVPDDEFAARLAGFRMAPVEGRHTNGSTFQSVARGREVETEYLNGEIVLLGRLHGVPTPANEALQRLLRFHLAKGTPPGTVPADELVAHVVPAIDA